MDLRVVTMKKVVECTDGVTSMYKRHIHKLSMGCKLWLRTDRKPKGSGRHRTGQKKREPKTWEDIQHHENQTVGVLGTRVMENSEL